MRDASVEALEDEEAVTDGGEYEANGCHDDCCDCDPMSAPERPVMPPDAFAGVYTAAAIEAQAQGTILVRCHVAIDGVLSQCKIVRGLPLLDDPVLRRLGSLRLTPAKLEGKPVPLDSAFKLQFRLPADAN